MSRTPFPKHHLSKNIIYVQRHHMSSMTIVMERVLIGGHAWCQHSLQFHKGHNHMSYVSVRMCRSVYILTVLNGIGCGVDAKFVISSKAVLWR